MLVLEYSVTHASNNSKSIITHDILEYSMTHDSQPIISQHVYRTFQNISGYLMTYDYILYTYIRLTTYNLLLAFYYYAWCPVLQYCCCYEQIYILTYKFPFL